jgi:hypothetical protein
MKKFILAAVVMFVMVVSVLPLVGCLANNSNDDETDDGNITIAQPNVPSGVGAPSAVIPDVDDADILGDADTAGATAVITLGTTVEVTGATTNVTVTYGTAFGTTVAIKGDGTYVMQGTLDGGFVALKKSNITLILNGVNIYSPNYASISCLKKDVTTVIELAEGSTNYLTDGGVGVDADGKYSIDYDGDEQPNATLLIRADLTVRGTGALIVNGNANNGIGSRANLTIESGNITVTARNNAVKGNDSVTISGGTLNIASLSDGIKNDEDSETGTILIDGGNILITATNDAVQALTTLTVSNVTLKIKTGGGSAATTTTDSAKGLKAGTALTITSGNIEIDSNDDCIHSNGTVSISGGTLVIASGDDGIHADTTLTISGGTIDISKSYEGIEGKDINLSGGTVKVKSSDDGINCAGGADSSSISRPNGNGGRQGNSPSGGAAASAGTLTISGGNYYVDANGDGLDSNGNLTITGGYTVVAQSGNGNEPVDYDGTLTVTGGTLIAYGAVPMAKSGTSTAQAVKTLSVRLSQGASLTLKNSSGAEILSFTAAKAASSLILSAPNMAKGSTYTLYSNGSSLSSFTV